MAVLTPFLSTLFIAIGTNMEALKIILFSTIAAICFGICHDLITTQISIEYFTIGHPKIIESEQPIHLALLWGTIATWWAGLIIGFFLAFAAQFGTAPKMDFKAIFKNVSRLFLIVFFSALISGTIGYLLAVNKIVYLIGPLTEKIHPSRHYLFLTVGWVHAASYIVGFLGSLILVIKIWRKRKKQQLTQKISG